MSVDKFEAKHGLVFNFSDYTGGMEREFCAFVIGKMGDCGVGDDLVELYEEDHPEGTEFYALSDRCAMEADDNGCYRPVSIYHDIGVDADRYHSLIIFLDTVPNDAEMKMILARAKAFCEEMPHYKSYMGDIEAYRPVMKGVKLLSNKVTRVVKTEKTFEV